MVITPSSYDPYTSKISFVQLNKERRGELPRQPTAQRIYNNFYPPQTVRMNIIHNGDFNSKPKLFVWRKWKGGSLDDLLEEAGRHLHKEVHHVYTEDGELIKRPDQVSGHKIYIFAGTEPFDYKTLESSNRSIPLQQEASFSLMPGNTTKAAKPSPNFNRQHLYDFDWEKDKSLPRVHNSRLPTMGAIVDDYPIHKTDEDARSHQLSTANSHLSLSSYAAGSSPNRTNEEIENEVANTFAELELKDQAMLARHREKFAGKRSGSAKIFNRKDTTYLIYVFVNGDGLQCQHLNFTKGQINAGMDSILEVIAQKLNVAPGRLVNLDGHHVKSVHQLISPGAYVMVPFGQNFRDTLYLLPANAIDTGENMQKIQERQLHRSKRFHPTTKPPSIDRINDTY